ncbi:hypothetical protein GIB67_036453 [Kingdonia uniflora]|uniref:ribose-5-phosphate isomerase n=1 Tax=Kingdonia uniflora TaxID=39325 RepID=A0A7J7L469_9MAGN|nr:hypothetical protein GIB67_036453 [Kingdonia uniflora]
MAISLPHLNYSTATTPTQPSQPPLILTQDELKKIAAYKAVDFVESGMVLGLGTGSTATFAVDRIGELLKQGKLKNIIGIPTSKKTQQQALSLGIPLSDLDSHPVLDLAIDGADEVDGSLNLVKGRGGSLLREKMVESVCKQFVVIVDESKIVHHLGSTGASIPIEVIPFCWKFTEMRLQNLFKDLGCVAKLRTIGEGQNEKPFVTDNANYIVNLYFKGDIGDLNVASDAILRLPGVVEHGMFLNMATTVIVAGELGVTGDGPKCVIDLEIDMGVAGALQPRSLQRENWGSSFLKLTFEANEPVKDETSLNTYIGSINHHLSAYSLSSYGLNDAFDKSRPSLMMRCRRIMSSVKITEKLPNGQGTLYFTPAKGLTLCRQGQAPKECEVVPENFQILVRDRLEPRGAASRGASRHHHNDPQEEEPRPPSRVPVRKRLSEGRGNHIPCPARQTAPAPRQYVTHEHMDQRIKELIEAQALCSKDDLGKFQVPRFIGVIFKLKPHSLPTVRYESPGRTTLLDPFLTRIFNLYFRPKNLRKDVYAHSKDKEENLYSLISLKQYQGEKLEVFTRKFFELARKVDNLDRSEDNCFEMIEKVNEYIDLERMMSERHKSTKNVLAMKSPTTDKENERNCDEQGDKKRSKIDNGKSRKRNLLPKPVLPKLNVKILEIYHILAKDNFFRVAQPLEPIEGKLYCKHHKVMYHKTDWCYAVQRL